MAGSVYRQRALEIEGARARAGIPRPASTIGPEGWAIVCEEIARSGNIRRAAALAGTEPRHIKRMAKDDSDYAQLLEDAWEDYKDGTLLPAAHERAVEGVLEPIYYQGRRAMDVDPGTGKEFAAGVRKYSDGLLMRLLEVHDKRFRPHQVVEQRNTGPAQEELDDLSPEARQLLEAFLKLRAADLAAKHAPQSMPIKPPLTDTKS